jgi:cation diffusion facilitator family transporter
MQKAATKSTYISGGVNLFLTILQVITGTLTSSQSLIADGVHSFADLLADLIVLMARHFGKKDADHDHHYGHHRYENAAALFLGVLLLTVGILMVYSALTKILSPDLIKPVKYWAIYSALLALIIKELLFRYMFNIALKVKSTLLMANAWHARSDAASSLVAAVGISASLIGYPIIDCIAALVVGLIIGKMGLKFSWESLHDLMDRSADELTLSDIKQTMLSSPGVEGVKHLKARKMGDLLLVDVHIQVNGEKSVREGHEIAIRMRKLVMDQHRVINVMTHVDPT